MDNTQVPAPAPAPAEFRVSKVPASLLFTIGALLFLFPFLDFKCNNFSVVKITGLELATGTHFRSATPDQSLVGTLERTTGYVSKEAMGSNEPNYFALAALVLGVVGIILALLNGRNAAIGAMIAGMLAVASLIGLMIDIKSDINKAVEANADAVGLRFTFTPLFFLALLFFIGAAFFSYRRSKPAAQTPPS